MKKIFFLGGFFVLLFCSFLNANNNVYAKEVSYDKDAYENTDEIYLLGNKEERYRKNGKTYTIDDYESELLGSSTLIDNVLRSMTIVDMHQM